jgi:hypothetical protein
MPAFIETQFPIARLSAGSYKERKANNGQTLRMFSQYYDTVRWVGDELAKRPEFGGMDIGLYAGSNRSGFWREGRFQRIQRIGQARSEIWIANLRYRDSVEDRVHQVLADRLEAIHGLFGQIPDTLEDVWVQVALKDEQAARQLIDRTAATRNPFDVKYSKVEDSNWETCSSVLNKVSMKEVLSKGW